MRTSPTIGGRKSKRANDDDDDDERTLLKQSSFQKNNAAATCSSFISPCIKKSGPSTVSPRDVRQIDSSFSFAHLEDDDDDNDDDIEQTLLAISSFEMASEHYDDAFQDENDDDTNSEYTGTQFVPGADAQQTYAQFVPGVNASLSLLDQSSGSAANLSIMGGVDNSIEQVKNDDDEEAQDHEQLLQTTLNEAALSREPSLKSISVPTPVTPIQEEDGFNDNDDSVDDSKVTRTRRRRSRCYIVAALLLLVVALIMIIVFAVSRRKRSNNADTYGKCSFCADGTVPLNLDDKSIDESKTCSDLLESQVFLDADDSQCQQGQALGWMFCGCPTLPSHSKDDGDTSCSYCPDGVQPIEILGQDCADFNTAVSLAGSSPYLSCEEAIAMVPDYCSCSNLDSVEQFSRLVRPISGEALEDSTSPQFRALEWMANLDPAKLTVGQDSAEVIRQRYVAAVLYFALGGTQWTDTFNFLSADKTCLWNVDKLGILCDEWDEITSIRLPNNNLAGSAIPPEISFYSRLNTLDLQSNAISGTLPDSIANMEALEEIDLSDNSLTGSLPSGIFRLSLLRAVDLSRNKLTGELPASLEDSTLLESLLMRGNGLDGTIPSGITQIPALQSLDLDANNISGTLPDFSPSSQMRQLLVGNNNITGTLDSIGRCRQLQILSAVNNDLVGTLPDLSENERLIVLEVSQNRLSGGIQRLFTTTPPRGVTHIQVQDNLLSGYIPTSIGLFSNLVELRLGDNRITGTIPTETGELLSMLTVLSLSNNRLTGTIPAQLGRLTVLQGSLDLASNRLSGTIPSELSRLQVLQEVDLAENLLTGAIPLLGSLHDLRKLRLSKNYLGGNVGRLLSSLSQTLQTLYLNTNLLTGTLPTLVGDLTALRRFEFFSNKLFGTLPSELGSLTALRSLQLTENSLNGTIPSTIGNCAALEFLSLGHNQLSGAIPTEIAKLTALERLFVVGNSLTGSLDFLCTRERDFDYIVANSCGANDSKIPCDCCTHCCDPTAGSCDGLQ